jgi:hypothetical protein
LLKGMATLCNISIPNSFMTWEAAYPPGQFSYPLADDFVDFPLHPGQELAVSKMNSLSPLVVIQGPPGTGKTVTIAMGVGELDPDYLSNEPCDVIVIITTICRGSVTAANKFLKRGAIDFKLVVYENFYQHNNNSEGLDRFKMITIYGVRGKTEKTARAWEPRMSTCSRVGSTTLGF